VSQKFTFCTAMRKWVHAIAMLFFPSVCYRTSNFELFGRFSPTWYKGEATGGHRGIVLSYLTLR